MSRTVARPATVGFALLSMAMLACMACSGSPASAPVAGTAGQPAQGDAGFEPPASAAPLAPIGQPTQPGTGTSGQALVDQPLIIYTGTMSLEVSDLQASIDQANNAVVALGGHVESSQQSNSDDRSSASVTYRIPAERWNDALTALRGVGQKLLSLTTNSSDVTAQVIDLNARIDNLRATETALQQIMDKATTISDVLKVQDQLTSVRGDIESMTAQRDHLANQAALSTLTVDFNVPVPATTVASGGWDFGAEVDNAVAALVRIGQWLASVLIWFVIVFLPVAVPILVLLWIVLWITRRAARRRAARPKDPPSWGAPPPADMASQPDSSV
jgi:Domain of unknown function (DUF4349)